MYKKQFLITENDRNYIKSLYGILTEQETIKGEKIKIDFGDLYSDGRYNINKSKDVAFGNRLNDSLVPFLDDNPNTKLNIEVIGGESATTNYDYELNDNQEKPNYYLAKKRREQMIGWLKNYFSTSTIEPKPIVDESPNEENVNVFRGRSGNAANDRFVEVIIKAESPDLCLIGLKIEVIYEKDPSPDFPCRGGHKCNKAKFYVLLNGVNLGIVDLNNESTGESKMGVVEVTRDKALLIAKTNMDYIKLSLKCAIGSNCHSDIPEIRITNKFGVLYHSCTPTLEARGDSSIKDLLVLDRCGTEILRKSEKTSSGEIKQTLSAKFYDRWLDKSPDRIKKLPDGTYEILKDTDFSVRKFKKGEIVKPD